MSNNVGWICPRCKKVHAPWVASCSCIDWYTYYPQYYYTTSGGTSSDN